MALSKEEYLKRYLTGTGSSNEKKTTKKKKASKSCSRQLGLKILDDDVDFKSILPSNLKNSLDDDLVEDKPVVVDLGLDDRPEKMKELERMRSSKQWKVISQNDDKSEDIPGGSKAAVIKQQQNSDRRRFDSESDSSPRQKRTYVDNVFPKRKRTKIESETPVQTVAKKRDNLDSASNSPALGKREHSGVGRSSKRQRHDSDESFSNSPQRQRHDSNSDSDNSSRPPRRCNDSDNSPPRRNIQDDSDNSPPRQRGQDNSPPRRSHRDDSDNSPPRQRGQDNSPPRRSNREDSDNSPPRLHKLSRVDNNRSKMNAHRTEKPDFGVNRPHQQHQRSATSLERDSVSKMLTKEKDLSRNHKRNDNKLQVTAVPEVIYRKDGKKRDLEAEQKAKEMEEAKKSVMAAKYKDWNKGLKQKEMADRYLADALHEVDKPLARYKDDHDLDMRLRDQDREGDPMLAFMKKKTSKATGASRPRYSGPQPPPNRYNLQPGYRWDGVDRSNGFEKKFFSKLSEDKAIKDIAYKWSTEDM